MIIDQVFPTFVVEKSTLRDRLKVVVTERGLAGAFAESLINIVPESLISTGAFLDKLTGIWRYEFGIPYDITNLHYWGTHMWIPVTHLYEALYCAFTRLPTNSRTDYLHRLSNPAKHQAILAEMIPAQKINPDIPIEFEVAGLGAGNRTIDWVIHPQGNRTVLLDVKKRTADFIKQAEEMATDTSKQKPIHDPALLFRSIEEKFNIADPLSQLQGAWTCTKIKQDENKLSQAFSNLSAKRVHFAILGDWESDAYILTRNHIDHEYLQNLFQVTRSNRFTYVDS